MVKKSDVLSRSRVSATEASRSFSRLLDLVEAGRRFVVHRHGRDVCVMAPAPVVGRKASECLALLRARENVLLDDRFGEDLLSVIEREGSDERPAWDD